MATRIDAVVSARGGWRRSHSALRLAVDAARGALERTGRRPTDVQLLINAGLFRDRNLGEPALAPLIQEDLGANPEDPHPGRRGTFSFDVANGACGMLSALQVADGFLRARTVDTVLVVTSDADPGHGLAPEFPFDPAGGALLCSWSEDRPGLGAFRWHTSADCGRSFRATLGEGGGRNVLAVHEEPEFASEAGKIAAGAALEVLEHHGVDVADVDLVVASPSRGAYRGAFSAATGIPCDRVVSAGPRLHTVGFVAALELASSSGRLAASRTVLFVCGGAGVTAGAALYRP